VKKQRRRNGERHEHRYLAYLVFRGPYGPPIRSPVPRKPCDWANLQFDSVEQAESKLRRAASMIVCPVGTSGEIYLNQGDSPIRTIAL